jgi:hypothetical protein
MAAWDLVLAIIPITALSVLAYLASHHLGNKIQRAGPLLFIETLGLSLLFSWCFSGKLFWANVMPTSGVVYWSNFTPILVAWAAGLACTVPGLDRWRRPATVTVLGMIAAGYLLIPIARPLVSPATIASEAKWQDGVCLQSHASTCAAAAAATLLHQQGIAADERDMIRACLTSSFGTEALGLYRGLKLATQRAGGHVRVASANRHEWMARKQLPNVALVRFANSPDSGSIRWLLGPRGEGHAVVVFGYQRGQWLIGDPAIGKVRWSDQDFRQRFTGDALYLSPSSSSGQ